MTRWSYYVITKDRVFGSCEFNGDMYPGWYWDEALELLTNIKDEREFAAMVQQFNADNFKYNHTLIFDRSRADVEQFFDMNDNYFKFRFSDRVFIKNLSDKDIWFKLAGKWADLTGGGRFYLEPNKTVRFNFGRLTDEDLKRYCEIE